MKNCVIYARQSSGQDDFSESVENQIEKCLAIAAKENMNVVGTFKDLNISGKTYPTGSEEIAMMDIAFQKWFKEQSSKKMFRDGLGELLNEILSGNAHTIIVYDITRLYRPISGSFLESHINQILMVYNVKIMTVNQGVLDMGSFNDSLITALQNRINHEQIAVQRKKAKEALKKLKDDGAYQSGIEKKWGFKAGIGKKEILIDDKESTMVKRAFTLFLAGYSLNKVCQQLNAEFPEFFAKHPIRRISLRKILRSPIYCGYIYNSEGNLVKSKQTDGFISFQEWKEAFDILSNRKTHVRKDKKHWYPLSGYIRCGYCGKNMIAKHAKHTHSQYYRCDSHLAVLGQSPCNNNMVVSRDVKYGLGLNDAITPILSLAAVKELEVAAGDEKIKNEIGKLKVEYTNLISREKKLSDMYINGLIDEDNFSTSIAMLNQKKKSLSFDILNKENMLKSNDNSIENQIKLINDIVCNDISHENFEKLVRKTIKSIEIKSNEIKIVTFYGDVILPKQKFANQTLLPHYWMNVDYQHNINLIYYYGHKEEWPHEAMKNNLIADFGKLKIWYYKKTW